MEAQLQYFGDRQIMVCPTYETSAPSTSWPASPAGLYRRLLNPNQRTYTTYSIWGLSINPNDVSHLCRVEEMVERQPAPINDMISWSDFWVSTSTPPTRFNHRGEKVNIWLINGSVRSATVQTLLAVPVLGGMNPLNNTYAWTNGASPPGYNGGPAIAFWQRVRQLF